MDAAGNINVPPQVAAVLRSMQASVPAPLTPVASTLVFVIGLVMWSVSTLVARRDTKDLFDQLGAAPASAQQLQTAALVAALVVTPIALAVALSGLALEAWSAGASFGSVSAGGDRAARLLRYGRYNTYALAAHVALLLVLAGTLSGTVTWFADMQVARSSVEGGGGGGAGPVPWPWPPASNVAALAPAPAPHALASTPAPAANAPATPCPPPCIDLGVMAKIMGLPTACFCQAWLLAPLAEQLDVIVAHLAPGVAGAVLMFVAALAATLHLTSRRVHAQYALAAALAAGGGGVSAPLLGA